MKRWRKKVRPLVMHEWTKEEYEKMSKFQFVRLMIIQVLYWNSFKELISKEFWRDLFSCIKGSPRGTRFFFMRYKLHAVMVLDDNVTCI